MFNNKKRFIRLKAFELFEPKQCKLGSLRYNNILNNFLNIFLDRRSVENKPGTGSGVYKQTRTKMQIRPTR